MEKLSDTQKITLISPSNSFMCPTVDITKNKGT